MLDKLASCFQTILPTKRFNCFGQDSLLLSPIPYYALAGVQLLVIYQIVQTYSFIFIAYGVFPLLDQLFNLDQRNPNKKEIQQLQKNNFHFQLCLYITIIFDWCLFFKFIKNYADFEWGLINCFSLIGTIFLMSHFSGVQFAVAHQLFHKQGAFNKILGTLHLSKLIYMHVTYYHIWVHHKKVATPEDPSTALKGENLYIFFLKSFFGSYSSVYKIDKQAGKLFFFNSSFLSILAAMTFISGVYYFTNLQAAIFFLITSLLAIFQLGAINYIEHYGLVRDKLPNGQYEKVTIQHSWNSSHRFTNYLVFKAQRHSDHHQNSLRPYQTLFCTHQSPQLPHGYLLMIMMSFFPSVWFKVIDPLVDQYRRAKDGKIQQDIMRKSVKQVRKFAIKLALGSGLLLVVSLFA